MTLLSIPGNPVPEGAHAGTIETPDGVTLRFARWAAPAGAKGTVCVFTGRGEYIEKYFETVQDLSKRGYAVAMIDWRGQGHSSRQLGNPFKGHVRNFSEYEADVAAFVKQVVLPDCPPPCFALAHSMGGAVMLRVARAGTGVFERFVLCAPMIDLPGLRASLPMRGLMRMMRAAGMGEGFIPGGNVDLIKPTGFPGNPLTSDPRRYARNAAILEADPTLGIASPTVAWLDAAFAAMAEFRSHEFASGVRRPVLMLAAGDDTIVSAPAIAAFARHLPAGSHRMIAGAKHEILQEDDRYREQLWAEFDAFMPG
ncbi:alpha/beta hydrolase [Bradyrhizobium sp. 200]|uniref:alpha/beta fold hydrolase n=1 Tax=Bradyrhizobium sp. 200 TaxID=2782665 RepID=UPI0020004011|nr:alpha/beta hydrolase [Bradyrhizobium sp. 200]UPJ47228.1 alpha/beta hydrolase [Bradyrhizobium sp. 200]